VPTVGVEATVPGDLAEVLWALDGTRPLRDVLAGRSGGASDLVRRSSSSGFVELAR
jgi:hypothetical protein